MSPIGTFIQVCAFEAVANPPWSAAAFEAAGGVGAGSMSVTVMGSDLTLIDICAARRSLAHRVSQFAVANERSLSVLAVPTQTDVWVQLALVHIQTGLHILRRHEAVEAETLECPWGICTLASVTGIWVLLTLVDISAAPQIWHQGVPTVAAALITAL